MNRIIPAALIAAAMLSAPEARAWDYYNTGTGQQIGDNATGTQNNIAQRQGQQQGQAQAQGQGQHQNATASNQGVTVGGNSYSTPRQVSSAIAPSITTINPCGGVAASGALQTGLFGISLGAGGGFDKMCQIAMYSSNPVAFQYACRNMDGFRDAARDAGMPCAMDRPAVVAFVQPARLGYVGPCNAPDWMGRDGACHPARPRPVVHVVAAAPKVACVNKCPTDAP